MNSNLLKQEFITTHGKVIIERDKLFIQSVKRELSWKSISFLFLVGAKILVIITPDISGWILPYNLNHTFYSRKF